jgi:hypothetical protein
MEGGVMVRVVGGVLFVALVATVGDYVWFEIGIRHRPTAGALHGALLLGAVGLVLGWLTSRLGAGVLAGMLAGVGGAAAYYALALLGNGGMNFPAMTAAWAAVWFVLAACDGRWLRRRAPRSWTDILTRGVMAAAFGALAFYLVLDIVWGRPPVEGRNYFVQFAAWAVAWAPGLLAIGLDTSPGTRGT